MEHFEANADDAQKVKVARPQTKENSSLKANSKKPFKEPEYRKVAAGLR